MNRREAVRLLAGAAGGILSGPAVLEVWARLTWRRHYWPGFEVAQPLLVLDDAEIAGMLRRVYADFDKALFPSITPLWEQLASAPRRLTSPRLSWGGESLTVSP